MPTAATANSSEVPFPFRQEDDATMLHPRVEAKPKVAKRLSEIKTRLPLKNTQGQSLLEKLASGMLDDYIAEQPASYEDDSWLNSGTPIQEHLEPPDWLEVLLEDLRKMPIKEPPEIDKEQLQKVKEGLDKLKEEAEQTLGNSRDSLLDTNRLKSLMASQKASQADKEPITSAGEGIKAIDEGLIETPTQCIPAVKVPTTRPILAVLDPVTPIPATLVPDSKPAPDFKKFQERQSDAIKPKETHYHIKEGEEPLDSLNAAIFKHKREQKEEPECIKISSWFAEPLDKDMQAVYNMPAHTHYPHITASGDVIGIPIAIDKRLAAAPHRIICIS